MDKLMAMPKAVTGARAIDRAIPASLCTWSHATAVHAFCTTTAVKAYGSRRLPETPT